jgi:hypothetical protein
MHRRRIVLDIKECRVQQAHPLHRTSTLFVTMACSGRV